MVALAPLTWTVTLLGAAATAGPVVVVVGGGAVEVVVVARGGASGWVVVVVRLAEGEAQAARPSAPVRRSPEACSRRGARRRPWARERPSGGTVGAARELQRVVGAAPGGAHERLLLGLGRAGGPEGDEAGDV